MATELQIAQGFQTLIQAMTEFSNGDVVINDDTLYDGAAVNCPYAIIYTATDFERTPASSRLDGRITIPIMHVEEFSDWQTSYNNLRNTRQAMIDEVFTGNGMSAGGLEGVQVARIRNLSEIEGLTYNDDSGGQTFPVFIQQLYGIEVELF